MRLPKHYFVFINSHSLSRIRQARISGVAAFFAVCLLVTCLAGIARIAGMSGSLAIAKFGYCRQRMENESLLEKISYLDKSLVSEKQRLEKLVKFEDRTRLVFGLNLISPDVRKAGIGGAPNLGNDRDASISSPFALKTAEVRDSLSLLLREVRLQQQTFEQMDRNVELLSSFWAQRPSIWPAVGNVTSGFGRRPDPITGLVVFHEGLDIASEIGSPVYAPADGIVKEVGPHQNYGLAVVLEHPATDLESVYGHLSNYVVVPHQQVRRGDLIGYTGNSGKSTGPHLHYEIRENGHPIDASRFILPEAYIVD